MSTPRRPPWITGIIVLSSAIAVILVVVVVFVVIVVAPAKPLEERPSVRYTAVEAHVTAAHTGGHELVVTIDLETTSRMPHMAPYVAVAARCGTAVDQGKAFFMALSKAMPGDRKVDTVELFGVDAFATPPDRCDLTLSLSEGATPPQRYCFQGGRTAPGACL